VKRASQPASQPPHLSPVKIMLALHSCGILVARTVYELLKNRRDGMCTDQVMPSVPSALQCISLTRDVCTYRYDLGGGDRCWVVFVTDHALRLATKLPCLAPTGTSIGLDQPYKGSFLAIHVDIMTTGTSATIQEQFMRAAEAGHCNRLELLSNESSEHLGSTTLDAALLLSCKKGHLPVIQYLVETAGASTEVTDADGVTPLLWAQRHNHCHVVNYLKSSLGVEFKRNGRHFIPSAVKNQFTQASRDGSLNSIQTLFQQHGCAIVEALDDRGYNALHCACASGHLEIVRFLLTMAGANVEATNKSGWTPLHVACCNGDLGTIKYLVGTAGAVVEAASDHGSTPLHWAAEMGHLFAVQYLVGVAGANVEAANKDGWTPLHRACSHGHLNVVHYLVQTARASMDATTKSGMTPLLLACGTGRLTIVQYFVETTKANVTAGYVSGWFLCLSSGFHGHLNVVQYILSTTDVTTTRQNQGLTPLIVASRNGRLSIVQYLLSTTTDYIDTGEMFGATALHYACVGGHLHVLQHLIDAGANVHATSKCGSTGLHIASERGHMALVVHLHTEARCNVHATREDGQTALHRASVRGHFEIVQYLVEVAGASVHTRDKSGNTPEAIAAKILISDSSLMEQLGRVIKYLKSKRFSQVYALAQQFPALGPTYYNDGDLSVSMITHFAPNLSGVDFVHRLFC
jgi:ankyrin repeat protein